MKEPNEIDLLFQTGLDDLTFTPDPYVKENIDHAIASKKKRRRFLFILFPVLFGVTGFAAIGLIYQKEKQKAIENPSGLLSGGSEKPNEKQNVKLKHSNNFQAAKENSSPYLSSDNSVPTSNTERKAEISKKKVQTSGSSKPVKSGYRIKTKVVTRSNNNPILSGKLPVNKTEAESNTVMIPVDMTSDVAGKIPDEATTPALAENKPDSTNTPLPDSASLVVSEALKHFGSNKGAGKWSLSVLSYWEAEKRKKNDFSDATFIDNQREIARVHSSTFYAKAEIGYQFNSALEILSGIGFRTSHVTQYGYLSTIITPIEGASSGVPQPINPNEPDTIHRSEKQSFRINSIVVPVGFAYTFPITTRISLRLSGGGEFAYGKITSRFVHPDLSTPGFNAFGCSLWLRPEIHYSFGRTQLFGFGTFNHSLSQQLKWNVDSRRNPAFGAGIGLRIRL